MRELTQSKIKEINRRKIITLLLEYSEISKLDISRKLNISITTVATNINDLKEKGIVEEVGQMESTGGRKAVAIKLIENCRYSLGVAFTPKHIKIVLLNIKKKIIDKVKIKHDNDAIENIIIIAKNGIEDILQKNQLNKEKIIGIGISIPGTVDSLTGEIKNSYLLNTKGFNIEESFKYLNIPIYVDNEANLSAYYEFLNNENIINNLLYISVTDGLGVGIIINGKIYRGENNASGELGHTKISIDGKQCKCGKMGCLEAYISKDALIETYNKATKIKINNTDDFKRCIDNNESLAREILKEYIDVLSVGIANLIMILDPNCIVLGGDINEILNIGLADLKEGIYKENIFTERHRYEIKVTDYQESYLLGSAMRPIEEYLKII